MKPTIALLLAVLSFSGLSAQYKVADSCVGFTLHIDAKDHPTDSIRFLYYDCEKIENNRDTVVLSNGRATVSGKVNRATEALLFVDHKNRWVDGPSVIRFILEPGVMSVDFTATGGEASDVVIKGSVSQQQKDRWEQDNASIVAAREDLYRRLGEINRAKDPKDSLSARRSAQVADSLTLLRNELVSRAFAFAKKEPGSFLSAYFLFHYQKFLPVDSLTRYYSLLSHHVRYSDFGKYLLQRIFKLTDDLSFRERYADSTFFRNLRNIGSLYDISLTNTNGSKTSLSQYKGKYLLLDFWGSWCGPCFRNAPYLEKLMAELKDKPIELISVSMDTDVTAWKASVKKHAFPGINLFDDSGLLSTYYKVLWVPRYIIIRPDGSTAHLNAPQPMTPELKSLLLGIMAEDKQ